MIRRLKNITGKITRLLSRIRMVLMLSYLVVILLSIALVGVVSFYISYQSAYEQVKSADLQIVRQVELNMDNDFRAKRYLLLAPYYEEQYIDDINAYSDMTESERFRFSQRIGDLYLKSFNTTPIDGFIRFQVYDNEGRLLTSSDNRRPWTADEVRNHRWFRETVKKDGRVLFDGPIKEPGALNDAAYASAILIRDFSNPTEFIVVRVEYNDVLFRSISRTNNISEQSRLLILNGENELVYASSPGMEETGNRELLSGLVSGSGSYWFGEGGGAWLVSYTRSDYSGWKTVLMTPRSEIIGPLERIKTATLLTGLAAFAVTAIVSLLFGRRITKPILSLYRSVSRLKRGDFSERAVVHRGDEIGLIAMKFNEMQDELQNLIETKYIYQIKLREAELSMLYAQINPHFLYNTLDIIKAQADYYAVGQIGAMAQSLADMFRYNLKSGGDGLVTLGDELEQIRSYMNIQRIRFEGKLSFELDIADGLHDYPLIKMTLQPLVENAVFHGIERSMGEGTIRLSAHRAGDRVRIAVSDNGAGIPPERLEALREMLRRPLYSDGLRPEGGQFGIGLHNVYARYKIRLGSRFDMEIDSVPDQGTEVSLLLAWDEQAGRFGVPAEGGDAAEDVPVMR